MFRKHKNKKNSSFQSKRTPPERLDSSFRRNTVVVSKSQRELKEHQQSVTQRQYDRRRKIQRRARRIRFITVVAAIGLAALFVRFQVRSVAVVPAEGYLLSQEAAQSYESTITELARQHTTAGQVWLLDVDGFSSAIQREYPEVAGATVSHRAPFSPTLRLELRFRTPQFVWRDANQQVQFVDSQGILFGTNRVRGIDTGRLVHIQDQSGVVLDAGSSVLTRQLVAFVARLPVELKAALPEKDTRVEQVVIPPSVREIHVRLSHASYLIKLSSTRTLSEQMKELQALINFLDKRGIEPRSYIDLRTPLKAYYK